MKVDGGNMSDKETKSENSTQLTSENILDANDRITYNKSFVKKAINNNTLLIDINNVVWIRTNSTGDQILKLIDEERLIGDIIQNISKIYRVPEALIKEDVDSFILDCYRKNVISARGKNASSDLIKSTNDRLNKVYINVTEKCNLNCPYCYNSGPNIGLNELSTEEWIQTLRQIDEMCVSTVIFTGGEPLLRKDLFDIIKSVEFKNIKIIGLITNGTCITNDNIDNICDSFDIIQIALDGVNKDTHELSRGKGSYSKVINSISLLKNAIESKKIKQVLLSMTVFKENKHEIRDMVRFAYSNKFDLSFFNVLRIGSAANPVKLNWLDNDEYMQVISEAYDEYIKITTEDLYRGKNINFYIRPSNIKYGSIFLKRPIRNCGLGIKELSIGSDGTVYPCRGLKLPELSIGNIRDTDIISLYKLSSERFKNINVNSITDCSKCDVKYFCGGGCRIFGYMNGDAYGMDPNCRLYKSSIYSSMICKNKPLKDIVDTTVQIYKNNMI